MTFAKCTIWRQETWVLGCFESFVLFSPRTLIGLMEIYELVVICHFTARRLAGDGTAREVVELILKAQGRWEEAVPQAFV
jgi:hypothetical protein